MNPTCTPTKPVTGPQQTACTNANDQQDRRTRCEVWTRVMGYHRPVQNFNIGKKSEHYSRTHFQEATSANSRFCQQFGS